MKHFGNFREKEESIDFNYSYLSTSEDFSKAEKLLLDAKEIAFDIETTSLSAIDPESKILTISFCSEHFLGGTVLDFGNISVPPEARWAFVKTILGSSISKIAHNGKFDVLFVEKKKGIQTVAFHYDTLLGVYLLDESPQKRGLKYLGKALTPYPVIEFPTEVKLIDSPPTEVLKYNCSDTRLTRAIYLIIRKEVEKQGLTSLWKVLSAASLTLGRIEFNGIKIDPEKLEAERESGFEELKKIETGLRDFASKNDTPDLDLNSPLQVRDFLFGNLNLTSTKKTDKGSPSTSKEALDSIDHPFVKLLLKYRNLSKILDTYYVNLKKGINLDGRIHPDYKLWSTRSGRTSCSEPNLQNIPREGPVRGLFIAESNNVFVEADYAQCELRVMAYYAQETDLIEAFKAGRDPHKEVASFLFHKPLEEVTDIERRKAKTLNFALLYGMGSNSLSDELSISYEEAASLINAYYDKFKKIYQWIQLQHVLAVKNREVVSIFGRKRRFPELKDGVGASQLDEIQKQSVNTIIQGTASDLALLGIMKVEDAFKKKELKAKLVLFVHDSVMAEAPEDEIQIVAEIFKDNMGYFGPKFGLPFDVDIKIGYSWGKMEVL